MSEILKVERHDDVDRVVVEGFSPGISNGTKCKEKSWIWRENMVEVLISFWEAEELLYNVNHPDYHNKDKRKDAVERISARLCEYGFNPAPSGNAITEKINSLRIYYVAQKNKLEHSRMSGTSDPDSFKVKWKYFESLQFLNDNVTPRYNHYNLKRRHNETEYIDYTTKQEIPYSFCEPRLYARDYNSRRTTEAPRSEPVESPPATCETLVVSSPSENNNTNDHQVAPSPAPNHLHQQNPVLTAPSPKSADMLFAEMVGKLLQNIPSGAAKDMLKIDIQKMIFQTQYGTHTTHRQFNDNR